MIEITETRTHIKQMKDNFKIAEVKKTEVADFDVDMPRLRITFIKKNAEKVHFYFVHGMDKAIADLINITNGMRI